LVLVLAAGCSRPQDAQTAEPPPRPEAQYSYAQANDLRVTPQLVSGWYPVEDGGWRWMAGEAKVLLRTPQPATQFEVRLTLPKGRIKATGPVKFSVILNDQTLAEETYSADDSYTLTKSIPPGMVTNSPTHVILRVDKPVPPVPGGDQRELGAIIIGVGFK
jgi:hypothetical protein